MKHTLRTTAAMATLLACGLALAQSNVNPNAKVDPKNNKVSRPVVEKAKPKLMSREDLRACIVESQATDDESVALKQKEKDVLAERDALRSFKADQDKAEAEMKSRGDQIKADIEGLNAFRTELEAGAPKMDKAELKAKQEDYTARANSLQTRIDAYNKERNDRVEMYKTFNARVDAQTKALDDYNDRVETLAERRNEWKLKCANKSYDEADEIAIKKELAAGKK